MVAREYRLCPSCPEAGRPFEANGGGMRSAVRHKPYLLFTWLNEVIRHPRILDAVEHTIGPEVLCRSAIPSFWIRQQKNPMRAEVV
jgi:hypothetical protein